LIGEHALDFIPAIVNHQFELIADITLLMVGYLLGGKLTRQSYRLQGKKILWLSISAAVMTTAVVIAGLLAFGVELPLAILLGCIASATAPAATLDIALETGYKGPFTDLLLSIVALDDAWALIIFSIGRAVLTALNGMDGFVVPLSQAVKDIGGAIVLGMTLGFPAAYLTGRIKPGQTTLIEALGLIFICGGVALWLGVSFLIASMVMGATIANFSRHFEYSFHEIENIEWPFMVIFFVLAGASLEFSSLQHIGVLGLVYIVSRVLGKVLGIAFGSYICCASSEIRHWMGIALLPQAGVAIGMALVASNQFPEYRQLLLSTVIATTILFEVIGPVFTRLALRHTRQS
jgi:Kef-type K+ transport system membrane component KefB